jgi:uncharacterized membrane protein YdjX (TVP38/TMEM64 family)
MMGVALAISGGVLAGLAGAVEAKIFAVLSRTVRQKPEKTLTPQWSGNAFYIFSFLFALLPLPFSVVRLAVLQHRPNLFRYGMAITLGRMPRYVLTVIFWRELDPPSWMNAGIVLAAIAFVAFKTMLRCRRNGTRALEDHRADFSCCTRASAGGAGQVPGFGLRKQSGVAQ